jgi:hypothetical protein
MPLPNNWYHLTDMLADVSTASSCRFIVPRNGYLRGIRTTLGAAITVADSVVTVSVNNVAASPTLTITQSGSAEGDVDSADFFIPVKKDDFIEVATDGASTTTAQLGITLTLSS